MNNSYFDPQRERSTSLLWGVVAAIVLALVAGGIVLTLLVRQVEATVDHKLEQITLPPITVQKYDSVTQTKIDSIETDRQMSHRHVDNYYSGELQRVLDSLYNGPQ